VSANNNKERARGKNVNHQYASRLKARLPKFNFLSLPSLWGRRHGNFRDTNFSRSLSLAALQSHKTRRSQTDDEFWKRLVDENDGGVKSTRVYIILTSPPAKPDMSRITSRWWSLNRNFFVSASFSTIILGESFTTAFVVAHRLLDDVFCLGCLAVNNACGKDVLLESVNIFWVSKRCVVVGGGVLIFWGTWATNKQTKEKNFWMCSRPY